MAEDRAEDFSAMARGVRTRMGANDQRNGRQQARGEPIAGRRDEVMVKRDLRLG